MQATRKLRTVDGSLLFGGEVRRDVCVWATDQLGTPAYLPPEQAQGQPVTLATDVYSLGAVCFEILTGTPPFGRGGTPAVALAHLLRAVPGVRATRPDVPPHVEDVILRALAKDPSERWPDASSMREALLAAAPRPAEPAEPARRCYQPGSTDLIGRC